MDKKTLIAQSSFGKRIAEEEVDTLSAYFVETEQWRKVKAGDIDVIYGPKGSGKSAIYSLLVREGETLRLGRRTVMIAAENPRGNPAFQGLVNDPPTSEDEFRGLWKFYFIALLAQYIRRHRDQSKIANADANYVIDKLIENRLLEAEDTSLVRTLKRAFDYIRRHMPKALEASISEPHGGLTATGKIILNEPTIEQRESGLISADDLIFKLNSALTSYNITVWLLIDRLDVAFDESSQLETNALRSLFRVYLDLIPYTKISIKIFLRDDIWRKLSAGGFREASHITRSLIISWDQSALLNLVVRRLLHNEPLCSYYKVEKDEVLKNAALQNDFFYRVFPAQIEIGQRQPKTLEWMLSRVMDGGRKPAPRELIHLLSASRDTQLKLHEIGATELPLESLFDKSAIKAALPEVSKARFEQTLCAEYPSFKRDMDRLEGEKTQQSIKTLAKLWKTTDEKAYELAERLTEIGFFERKGGKENPAYWVPFIYRGALNMVQGSAESNDLEDA